MILVPRVVHIIWVGASPYPFPHHRDAFARLNPTWDVWLWTDQTRPHLGRNEALYQALPAGALRADLLRLHLLAEHGGLYTDADSTCLRPLDDLVAGRTLAMMTGNRGRGGNGTLLATSGHPAVVETVRRARRHVNAVARRGRPVSVHRVLGGRYVRRIWRRHPDFTLLPRWAVCPRRARTPNTVVMHTSANTWQHTIGKKVRLNAL